MRRNEEAANAPFAGEKAHPYPLPASNLKEVTIVQGRRIAGFFVEFCLGIETAIDIVSC